MENLGEWEQKILLSELTQGMEGAKQLQVHLNNMKSLSNESCEFLVQKILNSYEKALSVLNWNSSMGEPQPTGVSVGMLESPPSLTGSPGSDENSDKKLKTPENNDASNSRKRKKYHNWTKQVKVSPGIGSIELLDDGFTWRKYGQKDILGAKYPRGYYRCTHRNGQGCLATKQVQRSDADPTIFEIAYRGRHTCAQSSHLPAPPPPDQNSRKQSPEIPSNSATLDQQFPSFQFPSMNSWNQNLESLESEFTEMIISRQASDSRLADPNYPFDYPGIF